MSLELVSELVEEDEEGVEYKVEMTDDGIRVWKNQYSVGVFTPKELSKFVEANT